MIIGKALTDDQLASRLKRLDKGQGVQQCITEQARAAVNENESIMHGIEGRDNANKHTCLGALSRTAGKGMIMAAHRHCLQGPTANIH